MQQESSVKVSAALLRALISSIIDEKIKKGKV
jgi:hypothetical protein